MKKQSFIIVILIFTTILTFSEDKKLSDYLIKKYNSISGTYNISKSSKNSDLISNHLQLTPLLKQVFNNWDNLTAEAKLIFEPRFKRPVIRGTLQTLDFGNFRFHFSVDGTPSQSVSAVDLDKNGKPDYIDNVIKIFTKIYDEYHNKNKYSIPPSDGALTGDNLLYDVYITGEPIDIGPSLYGYVMPEKVIGDNPNSTAVEIGSVSSFMVIRNEYSGFIGGGKTLYDILAATCAHEYFHSIQYGYTPHHSIWLAEMTATWAESFIYPTITDNYQYILGYFQAPFIPLNLKNNEDMDYSMRYYGSWIFAKYLTEQTSDLIIKEILEKTIKYTQPDVAKEMNLIDDILKSKWNSNVKKIFHQFVVSSKVLTNKSEFSPYIFTKADKYDEFLSRYIYKFSSEGDLNFTGGELIWNTKTSGGNNSLRRLSSNYFSLHSTVDCAVSFIPENKSLDAELVVLKYSQNSIEVQKSVSNNEVFLTNLSKWDSIIPIIIRYDIDSLTYGNSPYRLKVSRQGTGLEEDNSDNEILIGPNPVNGFINITAPLNSKITIYSFDGKKIYSKTSVIDKFRVDLDSYHSGMYMIRVETQSRIHIKKILIQHK